MKDFPVYGYLAAKGTKKCVTKQKLKFESYRSYLEGTQQENKINQLKK